MSNISKQEPEVLVVGAGPVGLTMACELLRHGVSCRIIDKNESAAHESRALGIQARTLEVFADMGIIDEVRSLGKVMHGINAYADKHRIAHLEFKLDDMDTPYPFALVLPQSETERVLNELLAKHGLEVERHVELKTLSQDENGVTATLIDTQGQEQNVRTNWLIGCDGAHSSVRHLLNLPFTGAEYPEQFLLADVQLDWNFPNDEAHIFLTPDGTIVTFPYPTPGRWRVIDTNGAGQTDEPEHVVKQIQGTLNAHGVPDVVVSDPTWTSVFRFHRRMVPQFRVGRCFVAGDAAHIHSPAGGQGMNTGIQDAYNLAWKLSLIIAGVGTTVLLDSYQAERHSVAAAVLSGGSDLTTKAVTLRNPVSQQIRNQLISFLSSFDLLQRRISRDMSELGINYRKSPFVAEDRIPVPQFHLFPHPRNAASPLDYLDFGAAPRSGDRAPDVVFRESNSTNETKRLFEILQGTQHTLLLFVGLGAKIESDRQIENLGNLVHQRYGDLFSIVLIVADKSSQDKLDWAGQKLVDADGALHQRYGAGSDCLYLIRPDGYIGYRSQPIDSNKFLSYLQRLFIEKKKTVKYLTSFL